MDGDLGYKEEVLRPLFTPNRGSVPLAADRQIQLKRLSMKYLYDDYNDLCTRKFKWSLHLRFHLNSAIMQVRP